jgi:hypothetical protein
MGSLVETAGHWGLMEARTRGWLPVAPLRPRARWSIEQAEQWRAATPWLVGCNFVPSTASNQLELWQADTFDPVTIDRELGFAAGLGMNSIRLFLHDLLWQVEGPAFLDRVDRVLDLAAGHGISAIPVLFDGCWDPDPRPGPQRATRPFVHNSTWVQGPGASVLGDRSRWPSLRPYVDATLERFGHDERVVAWDLFNEPDNPNLAYVWRDAFAKSRRARNLLEEVWDWAVEVDPAQPLTVGVYLRQSLPNAHGATVVARTALERSDVVSFHSYGAAPSLRQAIANLGRLGRPMVCTEWLGRPKSPPAQLEVFRDAGVGAYAWGLVDGRSQARYSWLSWGLRSMSRPEWFHELLHADGRPYDQNEVDTFRRIARGE